MTGDFTPDLTEAYITLTDFLKYHSLVGSGGEAKMVIQDGHVQVNGEVETRRRRKLHAGDIVSVMGEEMTVAID